MVRLTALVGGAAVVGPVHRLAARPRLAALPHALHVAGQAAALLASTGTREFISGHVHHVP